MGERDGDANREFGLNLCNHVLNIRRDRGDIPVCVKIRKEGGFLNGDQEKVYKIADCTLQRKRAGRKVVGIKGLP